MWEGLADPFVTIETLTSDSFSFISSVETATYVPSEKWLVMNLEPLVIRPLPYVLSKSRAPEQRSLSLCMIHHGRCPGHDEVQPSRTSHKAFPPR